MTQEHPGIDASDVTVTYRTGLTALRDASFTIPRGTITALVGVNGAGKSTLFKAIMGFVPLARGRITLMGHLVPEALKANLVAYVPQAEEVDWTFPVLVEDVVMMGRYGKMGLLRRPSPADRAAVDAALERVAMQDFRHRQIGELSGGQKKRVFLARALAQEGQVILLDEPTAGMSVDEAPVILNLIRALKNDPSKTILLVEHKMDVVRELADRIIVLTNGTLVADGEPAAVIASPVVQEAYLGVSKEAA